MLHRFHELGTEFAVVIPRPQSLGELTVVAELAAPCDEATSARAWSLA